MVWASGDDVTSARLNSMGAGDDISNVVSFSAATDASSDAATAFHNAVSAVSNTRGTVLIPPGNYLVNSRVTLANPITILMDQCQISAHSGLFLVTSDDVSILGRDSLVSMVQTWNATEHTLVEVQGAARFKCDGVRFVMRITGDTSEDYRKNAILIRQDTSDTTGSTNFIVSNNQFDISATQPSTNNRVHAIFPWTRVAARSLLVKGGVIEGNIIDNSGDNGSATRIIQCARAQDINIVGNVIRNAGNIVDTVGISLIGVENISAVGNTIENNSSNWSNMDGIAVRGDAYSKNVTIAGNTVRSGATSGRGVKLQAATSGGVQHISVVGNTLMHDGSGHLADGILVQRAAAVTCQDIWITGNQVQGWARGQIEVDDGGGGEPSNVYVVGNLLDGTNPLITDVSDTTTGRIIYHSNIYTSGTTRTEYFPSPVVSEAFISSVSQAATAGEFRLPNTGNIQGRNAADDANVIMLNLTSGNNVQVGGANAAEVQLTDGTSTARFVSGGHFRPDADDSQDLGSAVAEWRTVFGNTFQSASTTPLSIATQADFNDMGLNDLRLVFSASGVSLCLSSGATLYVINSALSEAQPTS